MLTIRVPRSLPVRAVRAIERAAQAQADEARADMRQAAAAGDLPAYRAARGRMRRALDRARAWRAACAEAGRG